MMSTDDDRDQLCRALRDPSADVRLRVIAAIGRRGESDMASELVQCALGHPAEMEGLEVVRALGRFPRGLFRTAALQTLLVQHPLSSVRGAASLALTRG